MEIPEEKDIMERPYFKHYKEWLGTYPRLKEVHLTKLNGKPINENEDAAWEIIEGAFYTVLYDDPKWHYFFESRYNLIRCSKKVSDQMETKQFISFSTLFVICFMLFL